MTVPVSVPIDAKAISQGPLGPGVPSFSCPLSAWVLAPPVPLLSTHQPSAPCSQVWSLSVLKPPGLPMTGSTYPVTSPGGPAAVAMGIGQLKGKTHTRPNPQLLPAQASAASFPTLQNAPGWRQRGAPTGWMEPKGQRRRDEQKLVASLELSSYSESIY